jgi:hypothetical protein
MQSQYNTMHGTKGDREGIHACGLGDMALVSCLDSVTSEQRLKCGACLRQRR